MEAILRNLLDKIYELEGLVHLSLQRDEVMTDFVRLIKLKGEEVFKISNALQLSTNEMSPLFENNNTPIGTYESIEENLLNQEEYETEDYQNRQFDDEDLSDDRKDDFIANLNRGKLVFSINEKFRFRRELFDNSDLDFNNTLALVASMEDYEEAESYFINEMMMNPSKPIVQEFLKVLKRYFQ